MWVIIFIDNAAAVVFGLPQFPMMIGVDDSAANLFIKMLCQQQLYVYNPMFGVTCLVIICTLFQYDHISSPFSLLVSSFAVGYICCEVKWLYSGTPHTYLLLVYFPGTVILCNKPCMYQICTAKWIFITPSLTVYFICEPLRAYQIMW